jgi:hypothetical protein
LIFWSACFSPYQKEKSRASTPVEVIRTALSRNLQFVNHEDS